MEVTAIIFNPPVDVPVFRLEEGSPDKKKRLSNTLLNQSVKSTFTYFGQPASGHVPTCIFHQGAPACAAIHMLIGSNIHMLIDSYYYATSSFGCWCWLLMGHLNTQVHCNAACHLHGCMWGVAFNIVAVTLL